MHMPAGFSGVRLRKGALCTAGFPPAKNGKRTGTFGKPPFAQCKTAGYQADKLKKIKYAGKIRINAPINQPDQHID